MGLGACTAMTLRLYADRKGWPLDAVHVTLGLEKVVHEGKKSTRIQRTIRVEGALDDEQRARLLEIANKCPVHQTLSGEILITSALG
jgi:putative redox protein